MKKPNLTFYFKLLFVFILALGFACSRNPPKSNSDIDLFYTIPFADIIKNQRQVKLSEVATDVEIIHLENIPEAMLANVEDIEFTKDYILSNTGCIPFYSFPATENLSEISAQKGKGRVSIVLA